MILKEPLALERGGIQRTDTVSQLRQLGFAASFHRSPASDDDRSLCASQRVRGRFEVAREVQGPPVDGRVRVIVPRNPVQLLKIDRHVEPDRGPVLGGCPHRLHGVREDSVDVAEFDERNACGIEERSVIDVLRPALLMGGDVPDDEHERTLRFPSSDECRERVGQSRPLRGRRDSERVGNPREAVGHGDGSGLVTRPEIRHIEVVHPLVDEAKVPIAHQPEHVASTTFLESMRDRLVDLHRGPPGHQAGSAQRRCRSAVLTAYPLLLPAPSNPDSKMVLTIVGSSRKESFALSS